MELDLDVFHVEELSQEEDEDISEHDSDCSNSRPQSIYYKSEDDTTSELQSLISDDSVAINLQACLNCNLQYQEMLTNVITELERALEMNLIRQEVLQEDIDESTKPSTSSQLDGDGRTKFFFCHAYPYFQDRFKMVCPLNEDAQTKQRCKDIDVSTCRPPGPWHVGEEKILCTAVEKSARKFLMEPLMERKEILSQKLISSTNDKAEVKRKLKEVNQELEEIKTMSLEDLFSQDVRIDWLAIANIDMKNMRSPEAYELRWKNYLSPKINKKKWTKTEDEALKKAVQKFNGSYWNKIAEDLQTGRSAIQCCQRYHCHVNPVVQKGVWSETEKKMLHEVVEMCQYGTYISWVQVHYYMEGRSFKAIKIYWAHKANPTLIKGNFSKEEDFLLISLVNKYGCKWAKVAEAFDGRRTRAQCRDRYRNCLRKSLSYKKYTGEEDRKLVSLVKEHGHAWADMLKYLPGRTPKMLSDRYKNILQHNPDLDNRLENETDKSKPLAPTTGNRKSEEYRDELHKLFEERCATFSQETTAFKRKSLKKFSSRKNKKPVVLDDSKSATSNALVLQEARVIYEKSTKQMQQSVEFQAMREAGKVVDGHLVSMLTPLVRSQPHAKRKYVALSGKNFIQSEVVKNAFYQSLNVPFEHNEEEEDSLKNNKYYEGASQTLESCMGPMQGDIRVLPPNRSAVEGFRLLLSDLNRLATSAGTLTDSTTVSRLTARNRARQTCARCTASPVESVVENLLELVSQENSQTKSFASEMCQECTRINQPSQRFDLLRKQFISMFFWPALMSTVQPPPIPDQKNGSVLSEEENSSINETPQVLKKKNSKVTAKGENNSKESSQPVTVSPRVPKKRRRRRTTSKISPVRKSLRIADKKT